MGGAHHCAPTTCSGRRAQAVHRLDRQMRAYLAPKVLVIDEFGGALQALGIRVEQGAHPSLPQQ